MQFDFLIVGAGFSGLTIAERLTSLMGKTCLLVDKRNHIGGNACDHYDSYGVLVHTYGPHYFRTNSPRIREYLSRFTEWHEVNYKILSFADGRYWSFPINLNTFEQLIGRPSTGEEMKEWLARKRTHIENPTNSEEVITSQVGWELYEKFFKGYTIKQWRRHPSELDASVCGRIPIRTNRDDRYLNDDFQALPKFGYSNLFKNMIEACGNKLEVRLNTSYRDILPYVKFKRLIFTGPIDEFFNFQHGRLPYRSLRFEPESFTPDELNARVPNLLHSQYRIPFSYYQPVMQVNYPGPEKFTRIVEIKHATGQNCLNTTIVREYPDDFAPGKEPYYPIPAPDSTALYRKYLEMAQESTNVSFIGRLATYRYYNMDQVIGMALVEFEKLRSIIR